MVTLRQLQSVVAVVEERSFTRAAARENATQSGISQHVKSVEAFLGVSLFERTSDGVTPTPAGQRYYQHCIDVLRTLDEAKGEARETGSEVTGKIRAGLIPAFTRVALAPALERFTTRYPGVEVEVIEGYSGALMDRVRSQALDFALVPGFAGETGLKVTHLNRSREMLVSGAARGLAHLAPVRLAEQSSLKLIVPSRSNVRRGKIMEYAETHGVRIDRVLDMDAMLGTLELVAASDWVTILPWIICSADAGGDVRRVSPLIDPPLHSEFVVIEPARRPLPPEGHLFLDEVRAELARLEEPAVGV
ncbi:LysR family transcriptional regulator [Rhodobacteraceae bacterium N5(2021)]|uniref:LysR family transcriptional regulator n=1 Tax=Gymnodinialimonas phycosphaerae TaxID=2841589 RepID=A0A975TXG6_9RHOB|nr:LysR family transcriptional regulator [Gymnodinialimonas phycosphaerae]MBY4892782.1 LysR family transcriptional regulator [Gymnodinialimonas phycosphaerae]